MSRKKSRKVAARIAAAPTASPALASPGLNVKARYDAAGQGRRMAEWRAPSTGPNKATAGLQTIRNRSRDAGRNEWTGASSVRVMVTSLIGTGIVARPKTKDKAIKAGLAEKWDAFTRACDAENVLDFYGMQVLGVTSWWQSGEFFARIRQRRIEDGLPVPMQVQLLESDMCPLVDLDSMPGMPAGNRIRQGVEFSLIGKRVAYWFHREHPGDGATAVSTADLVRVPADQVIHVYKPVRIGQIRGVPESAPILAKLRQVMSFDDAVLTRQQIANLFTVFVKRPMPTAGESNIDPLTGKTVQYDSSGAPMASLEPGISQELMPGEDVIFSDPPDSGANYPDFMRQQHMGVFNGQGIPYELGSGDIRDVSDRTLRIVINEFRRWCEQLQWTVIIPMFCQRVRAAWASAGLISGALSQAEYSEAMRTEWAPQAWSRIHPTQDVQAEQMEVDAGFRSRSSVIASRGYDAEDVDEERAADQQREAELGIKAAKPAQADEPAGDPRQDEGGDGGGEERQESEEGVQK